MAAMTFEDILKFNDRHDPKTGRFAPKGTGVSSGGGSGASDWSRKLDEEKARVLAMEPNERALYVLDHDGETYDNCVAAMENGQTEALVNNYFAIMKENGDPTPTKPLSGQMSNQLREDVDSGKYEGYQEARQAYIEDVAGQTEAEAKNTLKSISAYFRAGQTSHPDRLDKYIEEDHAYEGKIHRGMHFDDADYESFMTDISPGATIKMRGNASWSSDEEVAAGFAHRGANETNSVMITCVGNRTSAPVDHLSHYGESEVLSHSQARWTVLHVETVQLPNGVKKTHITVVERGEYDGTA